VTKGISGPSYTPAVEYRPLTADLRDAAAAFAARIPERDKAFLDRFLLYDVAVAGWTRSTPARRIVALDGADVVGLVTVEPQRGWMDHVGEFRLVVQPSVRGQGVGQALIEQGVELASSLGLRKLSIEIMASNTSALGLFERHGFQREAVLVRHVRDGEGDLQDLVVMTFEPAADDAAGTGVDAGTAATGA
jgi:ribosomal protein S18 acetylase RimI-like enzyme